MVDLEQLTGPPERAAAVTDAILREYLAWAGGRLVEEYGASLDLDSALEMHHQYFIDDLPHLVGPRGRLLVARQDAEVVGVGGLMPVDDKVAEIKRMYVRPHARGQGLGRAILQRLVADATELGYHTARLESAQFMTEAHALYRSHGFRDADLYADSETSLSGLERFMVYMELPLRERVH
jgi:GNAT superfamily N-acetyltransferase